MSFEYGFDAQLKMSEGVDVTLDIQSILMAHIPGALNVEKAATDNDKLGVDWWVEMNGCRHLAVDAKVRDVDYSPRGEDDLALETWSVVEKNKIGWTRDVAKVSDYILWLWKDTKRFHLVPFPMLCGVFCENWQMWKSEYKTKQQETATPSGRWHSECIFVPRHVVWRSIYMKYSGNNIAISPLVQGVNNNHISEQPPAVA